MIRIIAFSLFLITAEYSIACSCIGLEKITSEDITRAKIIFVGEAIHTEEIVEKNQLSITFKVLENLKGTEVGENIIVTTSLSSGMCGINVLKNEKWYLFGDYFDDINNSFPISSCSRSARISKRKYGMFQKDVPSFYWRKGHRKELRRYRKERRFILKN